MNASLWRLAADVVASWLGERRSPRDTMAAMPSLRGCPGAERALVSRASTAAIAGMRRLEFVLAGPGGLASWPVPERALLLVLAAAVARSELSPGEASQVFAATGHGVDFAVVLQADARLQTTVDPLLRLAREQSLPDWFAARAIARFGDDVGAVAAALLAPAPRTLRANLLKVAGRDELAAELAAAGIATTQGRFAATALHVQGDADLFATAAFARGAFEQQDEASQLVAAVTAPPPGGKVLDLCAGNGGKTLALAAALRNRGVVMATDVHEGRLQALRERARRAGATNLAIHGLPGGDLPGGDWPAAVTAFAAHADRILVDAPCSGTGSWRRRPEARWAFDEDALAALARTQDELLERAVLVLRPGARLVYATCSLLESENEQRVAALLARHPALELVRIAEVLGAAVAGPIADASGTFLSLRPDQHGCDGFFAAVVRRRRVPLPQ